MMYELVFISPEPVEYFHLLYRHWNAWSAQISISLLGYFFHLSVPGGDDKLVKVWDYMEGVVTHTGIAHGGSITSIKVCSNNRTLVSTSADGAILRWRFPHPSSA